MSDLNRALNVFYSKHFGKIKMKLKYDHKLYFMNLNRLMVELRMKHGTEVELIRKLTQSIDGWCINEVESHIEKLNEGYYIVPIYDFDEVISNELTDDQVELVRFIVEHLYHEYYTI